MTRAMPTWLLIAALATVGITALLIGVLYRVNKGALERAAKRADGEIRADETEVS